MITVGIDLASQDKETAIACIRWGQAAARVIDVRSDVSNEVLIDLVTNSDKAGIDCPFGWPDDFLDVVNAHQNGHVRTPVDDPKWRRRVALRHTDRAVNCVTGLWPLSVAADRIAMPALRCAGLLGDLHHQKVPVDRSGSGRVVEVYPRASLLQWRLHQGRSYKNDPELLKHLVGRLPHWLTFDGELQQHCRSSDHAFDAVIAALTARAAERELVSTPKRKYRGQVRREGWIALPSADSLAKLVGGG